MPSFSKAIAFLTAFAVTSSITTITTVDAACECIGLKPALSKFFSDKGWSPDLGSYCLAWDALASDHNDLACAKGGSSYGAAWCTEAWCYVDADNTCADAIDTVAFADTSMGDTLQFATGACGIDTCGECLPIMEGDDAVIGVRLWHTGSEATDEYVAAVDEVFTPYYSSQPGFISYTGVVTQDPDVVMFISVFDTEANSAAAYDTAKDIHDKELHGDPDDEILMNYFGKITWTGVSSDADEDCVKSSDFGDYFSARMFYTAGNDRPQEAGAVADNYKAWTAVKSFDSYTSSTGMGEFDDESFFFETFDDEDDSVDANELALQNTNLDPTTSLIYNVQGQVVFDSTCRDHDDKATDDGTCETIADIIRSNPRLSHFEDLYEAATNAEGYYVDTDTWTLFAPTDEAIKNSGLVIDDVTAYAAIRLLMFHEVKGQALTASDLICDAGENLIEMGSGQATRTICSKDSPIGQKGGGNASPALFMGDEIVACNGVIHIIDEVLLPPSTVSWYSGLSLD